MMDEALATICCTFAPKLMEMAEKKRIYLCLAHMSETGEEQKYIKEAFDTNWVVPSGRMSMGSKKILRSSVERTNVWWHLALVRRQCIWH